MGEKEYYLIIHGEKIIVKKQVYLQYQNSLVTEIHQNRRYQKYTTWMNQDLKTNEDLILSMLEEHGLKQRLEDALMQLTDSEYEVIAKLFFEGVSERELAKEYQTSQSSINRMKQKIFLKLKQYMLSE